MRDALAGLGYMAGAMVLGSGVAVAQGVSVAFELATPLTVSADAGAGPNVQTLAAGPVSNPGSLQTYAGGSPGSQAGCSWNSTDWGDRIEIYYRSHCGSTLPTATGSADVSLHEALIWLSSPTPRTVHLATEAAVQYLASGQPAPMLEIDVMDDGIIDYSLGYVHAFPIAYLAIGPQPVAVRIRAQAAISSGPSSPATHFLAHLTVRPANGLSVTQNVIGCVPGVFYVTPSMESNGINLRAAGIAIGVVGLSQLPVLLPSQLQGCLLMPSPDLLVIVDNVGYDLDIPAAARPIDLYAQGVYLVTPTDLRAADGFLVTAF